MGQKIQRSGDSSVQCNWCFFQSLVFFMHQLVTTWSQFKTVHSQVAQKRRAVALLSNQRLITRESTVQRGLLPFLELAIFLSRRIPIKVGGARILGLIWQRRSACAGLRSRIIAHCDRNHHHWTSRNYQCFHFFWAEGGPKEELKNS